MKKLLIWDIDGTILNCKGCGRQALSLTFEKMYGFSDAFKDVDLTGKIDSQVIDEIVEKFQIKDFVLQNFFDKYGKILFEVMRKIDGIDLLPGVKELLETYASDENIYLSLATGNCKTGAMGKLDHCEASHYFEIGAYGDEAENRGQLVNMALTKAKSHYGVEFKKEHIYYIGDTPKDIEAARVNKIKSVAVSTGFYEYSELEKHDPDFLIKGFNDLAEAKKIFEF